MLFDEPRDEFKARIRSTMELPRPDAEGVSKAECELIPSGEC
jgi:hypothetical protein